MSRSRNQKPRLADVSNGYESDASGLEEHLQTMTSCNDLVSPHQLPQGNYEVPHQVPHLGGSSQVHVHHQQSTQVEPPQYNQLPPQLNQVPLPQGQEPPQYNQLHVPQYNQVPTQNVVNTRQRNFLTRFLIECCDWFQDTSVNVCLCFGAIFIALIIGILLGALGTLGILAGNPERANNNYIMKNTEGHTPTVSSEQPEPTPSCDDLLTKDKEKQCDANYTQTAPCPCDSNDNKDNIDEELTTCNNNKKELETSNTHLKGKLYGFKQNFTTYINGLGDVIEEYNINNAGKEWSQWCIQEWKKQDDTSPLSKPTASMDINKHFDKLADIHCELTELMKLLPSKEKE